MQTGIVRTADGLLLPGFGPLAMFKMLVEVALKLRPASSKKARKAVRNARASTRHCE